MNLDSTIPPSQKIPTTIEEAHQILEEKLDKLTLNGIDSSIKLDWMDQFHHSLGRFLRNSWGLWTEGSPFRAYLEGLGFKHPDDMSGAILRSFWFKRHGIEYSIPAMVGFYQAYWDAAEKDRPAFGLAFPVPTADPMLAFARQFTEGTITKEDEGCN